LDAKQASADFWDEPQKAQELVKEYNSLKRLNDDYYSLSGRLEDLLGNVEQLNKDYDPEMHELLELEYQDLDSLFNKFEMEVLLSNKYDHANAYLEIHPGAGGTEAQDWAQMLFRMYQRYCEKQGYSFAVQEYEEAIDAGIKSCMVLIKGDLAYGYLKGESGVHRLVRISPFDSNSRRHTSFAAVEITPELPSDVDIQIDEKDLEIDTMRSSGAGGQHINKTDSAVRIKHIPTNIIVFCQSERSQLQNKERCMELLKAKLYKRKLEEQEAEKRALKGEQKKIEWGSQIRSYVFCPYTLVKDHRSNYEEGNVDKVMDGELDGFLFSYLKTNI